MGLTGTSLTNKAILFLDHSQFPADMSLSLPNLLIVGTFVSTSSIANTGVQIGDQTRLENFSYNGATEFVWYGYLFTQDINRPGDYTLTLGDAAYIVDRTTTPLA